MIPNTIKASIKTILNLNQNNSNDSAVSEKSSQLIPDERLAPFPYEGCGPVRILLVIQHISIWTSWRSVWKECNQNDQIEVHVVIVPFIHPYGSEKIIVELKQCLKAEGVPFFLSDFYAIDSFKPHVVMLQNPYDSTRPDNYSSEKLSFKGYRIAYIPYGLEMGGGEENINWQFNLDFHHNAWRIFARSKRHKAMYAKYSKVGDSNVVITGHPKFDFQAEQLASQLTFDDLRNKIAGRKVVLWTPHFSVGLPATWSTYRIYGEAIINETQLRPDLFFIIRPHPLFFKAMIENELWAETDEAIFKDNCKSQNNLWLDESFDYIKIFSIVDVLMTDVGSFLLEFLPTGKPILYLHHPEGVGLNDDGELVNYLYKAESVSDITQFLNDVQTGEDSKKTNRLSVLSEYLFVLDGNAGKRICEIMVKAVQIGDELNLLCAEPDELQKRSFNYWSNASNSFLAPPQYYEIKKQILHSVITQLPQLKSAIDIGCGNGVFTKILAEKVDKVIAYDISQSLIQQAIEGIKYTGISNISFEVKELEDTPINQKFELVACMGVTSCILDDHKFVNVLDILKACSISNGYLLMIDSLALNDERIASGDNGYIAKYRNINSYNAILEGLGFIKLSEVVISEDAFRNLTNRLFLFKSSNLQD